MHRREAVRRRVEKIHKRQHPCKEVADSKLGARDAAGKRDEYDTADDFGNDDARGKAETELFILPRGEQKAHHPKQERHDIYDHPLGAQRYQRVKPERHVKRAREICQVF